MRVSHHPSGPHRICPVYGDYGVLIWDAIAAASRNSRMTFAKARLHICRDPGSPAPDTLALHTWRLGRGVLNNFRD